MSKPGKIVAVCDGKRCQVSKKMKTLKKNQNVYLEVKKR